MRFPISLLLVLTMTACKVGQESTSANVKEETVVLQDYAVMVKFSSEEGLKRGMYELENLKIVVEREVSAQDHIYLMKLRCQEFQIDGIIRKLNENPNFEWAHLAEP